MRLAFYRKYRPQTFGDVIGQEHIVKTLSRSVTTSTVSHAYLFCGSRGTGKTTVARILARALTCEQPLADGSPCGKCHICAMTQNLDIIEIDAASNSGVEEIRTLRAGINFAPQNGKYKVYIIDEVHMLSIEAFNALLKTLEEPPPQTVFILATTESQKLPMTILSRCMRFDFRLVGIDDLFLRLKQIFESEGLKATDEALRAIAYVAEGSVRDMLSIAQMCSSFAGEILEYSDVLTALGASDPRDIMAILHAVFSGDVKGVFEHVYLQICKGKSVSVLTKDLREMLRNLGIIKVSNEPEKILNLPIQSILAMGSMVRTISSAHITYTLENLLAIESDLRLSINPRIILETALIKSCILPTYESDTLAVRVANLEAKLNLSTSLQVNEKTPSLSGDVKISHQDSTLREIKKTSSLSTGDKNESLQNSSSQVAKQSSSSQVTKGSVVIPVKESRVESPIKLPDETVKVVRPSNDMILGKVSRALRIKGSIETQEIFGRTFGHNISGDILNVEIADRSDYGILIAASELIDGVLAEWNLRVSIKHSPTDGEIRREVVERLYELAGDKLTIS